MAKPNNLPKTGREDEENDEGSIYDPYEHRQDEDRIFVSDFGSWTNLVKSAVGTGLFAIPYAYSCVGIIIGTVGTILMGILITTSLQFLVRAHYMMCVRQKKPTLSYKEVVSSALNTGPKKIQKYFGFLVVLVDITLLTCYVGIGAVYIVFISGVVQEILDSGKTIHQAYYTLMLFPFFAIMNMVKNLKLMAPLSIIGNIFLLTAAIIGIVYSFKDGIGDSYVMIQPNVKLYPRFLGPVFFSMCSPGLILSIENDMKNPQKYSKTYGILNCGMAVIVVVHILVGITGYLKWGNAARGNFIRNHLVNDIPTVIALVMQASSIFFSYGLQCYLPISIIYNNYILPSLNEGTCCGTPFLWDLLVRLCISLITCLLAATIPKLDLFISLVGAICIASLGVLIPVILDIIVHYGHFGKCKWRLCMGIFMFAVALVSMICASVISIVFIVRFFTNKN